ncbi:uncharacterized protein [Triticum aestivum]|uniref:uncharacterized protein isoform X3 n=1 Tax=Triticum aestivum TaxID=4565 RepID=UPI001D018E5F|nr:uncharacterized protein LOC123108402 isoform X3 [Triticum aestivum]
MGSSFKSEWGPAICMVLIELFTTGQLLLTKVVVDAGLMVFALLTYRFFLGAALVVPLALILEPALVGFTIPGFAYIGLGDTSPGYAVNFYNIIPIAAFILAVLFRHEEPGGEHQGRRNPSLRWRNAGDQPVQGQGAAPLAHKYHRLPPKASRSCFWSPPCAWNHLAHHQQPQPRRLVHSTGSDAKSVPIQVLVHCRYMLRGEHPNGCRGGCHEQREGNMGAQMEHELAHHCVLGNTQHCCQICDDFMGRHAAWANLSGHVLCRDGVLHYYSRLVASRQ